MLLPTECFSQSDTGVLKTCHRFDRKSHFTGGRGGGSPARLDPRLRCTTRLPRADRLGEWPQNGGDARRKRPAAAAAASPHSSAASLARAAGARRLPRLPRVASGGLGAGKQALPASIPRSAAQRVRPRADRLGESLRSCLAITHKCQGTKCYKLPP